MRRRWSEVRIPSAVRFSPLVILVVGLILTALLASSRTNLAAAEQAAARELSSRMMTAAVGEAEQKVVREAVSVDRIMSGIMGAESSEEVERLLVDLGAFSHRSPIEAVFMSIGGRVQVFARPEGDILSRELPSVPVGLTQIDAGLWQGLLSYGQDRNGDKAVDVVMVINAGTLRTVVEQNGPNGTSTSVFGFPGDRETGTATSGMIEYPANVYRDRSDGPAYLQSAITFLGVPVTIELEAAPAVLWEPDPNEVPYILGAGLVLSLALAAAVYLMARRVDRAMFERDRADAAREAAAARFRASFAHAPIGVVELAEDGRIVAANPRFASQLGYASEELVGSELLDLLDGEDRPAATERLDAILGGGLDSDQAERRYRNRNGAAVWVRESVSVVGSDDGTRHVLVQAEDISDERRARAELHRKALFDELTGLPNRANLIARLNRAIEGEQGSGEMLAVMFVDLDKFKQVNDTLGHEAGDLLLIEVAERLRRACRSTDTVARLGGDEFVVVCEGLPDEQAAELTAARFADSLRESMFINEVEVPVSASIGFVLNSEETSSDAILRQADQAMYRAKTSGRNQLVRFDIANGSGLGQGEAQALVISPEDVAAAIADDQFRLHYQPIVRAEDHSVVGLEALIRWQHPELGLLNPPDFLQQIEEHQLVEEMDDWVLGEGLRALARWTELSPKAADWYLVFNISPTNYNRRSFVRCFGDHVEAAGVDPRRVVLERNETWFMSQTPTAVVTTRELRKLGARISLDHFGTGSSSLTEVSTLEFDLLKIDRSFVRGATDHDNYVLEALKRMSDALGLRAIVEGVESADELRIVKKSGIDFAQGFHFSRPLDEAALIGAYLEGSPVGEDARSYQIASGSSSSTS